MQGVDSMKKMFRNVGAILSVGGVGVYTVYKMVFGRVKKNEGLETEMLKREFDS